MGRRVIHLRSHHTPPTTPPTTPLADWYNTDNSVDKVKPTMITGTVRLVVRFLGPLLGFLLTDVIARYIRASGANALLCAGVDTDIIILIGR